MSRTANKTTPIVKGNVLSSDDTSTGAMVGSDEWFDWLETASTFYYEAMVGTFTAKREKRRSSFYWFAYRRFNHKLHNAYLGKDDALTADYLAEVANKLHNKANNTLPDRVPVVKQVTQQVDEPVAFDTSLLPTATIHLDYEARRDGQKASTNVPKPTATIPRTEPAALDEHERTILEIMTFSKPYGSRYTTRTDIYREHKAQLAAMVEQGLIKLAERKGSTMLYLPTEAGLAALQSAGRKR